MNLTTASSIIDCPFCGEPIELIIDCSEPGQQYTEDCSVCCQPIALSIVIGSDDSIHVTSRQENE